MGFINRLRQKELDCHPSTYERDILSQREFIDSMQHSLTLEGHIGCVNSISWNEAGTLLASGSDDLRVIIWSESGRILQKVATDHTNNIFSVIFFPSSTDNYVASGAGDGNVLLHDLDHIYTSNSSHVQKWSCSNRVKRLAATPAHPKLFWSAAEDGILRQHDIRCNEAEELLTLSDFQLKSLAINAIRPEMFALALNDPMVPIYDRRYLRTPQLSLLPGHLIFNYDERHLKSSNIVTHVEFNGRGDEIIVNIGNEQIYIYDVASAEPPVDIMSSLERLVAESSTDMPSLDCSEPKFFHEVIQKAGRYIEDSEFSKAIDIQSTALAAYLHNKRLSYTSLLRCPLTDCNASMAKRSIKLSEDLTRLVCQRGSAYTQRAFDGDEMAALRDYLWCVGVNPRRMSDAYFRLAETLYHCFDQHALAQRYMDAYEKYYATDNEKVQQFIATLRQKSEQLKSTSTTASSSSSSTQKKPKAPWSKEKYDRYRDYTDRLIGHCNMRTDIKEANWFGGHDDFIVGGSDSGLMFIWERSTQKILRVFKADEFSVNCVQCHPRRLLIASSGIDHVIRFWEPAKTAKDPVTEEERSSGDVINRDKTDERYKIIDSNNSALQENPFEIFVSSIGLPPTIFSARELSEVLGAQPRPETDGDEEESEDRITIPCRTM